MIGYSDFKDTIKNLFEEHGCVFTEKVSVLKDKKLGIDLTSYMNQFLTDLMQDHSMQEILGKFDKNMKDNGINYLTVNMGVSPLYDSFYQETIWKHCQIYTKIHFFKILTQMHNAFAIQQTTLDNFSKLFLSDSLTNLVFFRYMDLFISTELKKLGIKNLKAPQLIENQLVWMYHKDFVDCIYGSPIYFIYKDVSEVIYQINFSDGTFTYFDFDKLAAKMKISKEKLRRCLLGVLLFMMLNKEINSKNRLTQACNLSMPTFINNYDYWVKEQLELVKEVIEELSMKITDFETVESLCKVVAQKFNFNKEDVLAVKNLLMNAPVLTYKSDFQTYPLSDPAKHKFILDTSKKEVTVFFCLNYMADCLFSLVTECTSYSCFPSAYRADSKENGRVVANCSITYLNRYLYKMLMILHQKEENFKHLQFNIQTFNNEKHQVHPKPFKIELNSFKLQEIYDKIDFFDCLKEFEICLKNKREIDLLGEEAQLSQNESINTVYLSLLDEMGYIDIEQRKISPKGHQLLKAVSPKYQDKVLLFFEAIKHGTSEGWGFHETGAETPIKDKEKLNLDYINAKFITSYQQFILIGSPQQNTSLYTLNANINKTFETMVSIRNKLFIELPKLNKTVINNIVSETIRKQCHFISIAAQVFILSDESYYNESVLFDYECQQFGDCLINISKAFYNKICVDLLYIFCKTKTKKDIYVFEESFKQFPFNKLHSPDLGSMIKVILVKYLLYKEFKKLKFKYSEELKNELSYSSIEKMTEKKGLFERMLVDRIEFVKNLLSIVKGDRKEFGWLIDLLTGTQLLLEDLDKFLNDCN